MMSKFATFKESFYRFVPLRFFCQVLVITKEIGWNIVLGKSAQGICLAKLGIAYCR